MFNPLELFLRGIGDVIFTIGILVSIDLGFPLIIVVLLKELYVCLIIGTPFRFSVVGIRCTFHPLVCFIRTYLWNQSVIEVKFPYVVRSFQSPMFVFS